MINPTTTANPKVDAFLARQTKWQDELKALVSIARTCGMTEELKWGKPAYTWQSHIVMVVAAFKDHSAILFFKGSLLKDPAGLLTKAGEATHGGRQMRFNNTREVTKHKAVIKSYINEAAAVEKAGLKLDPKTKPVTPVPAELTARFAADPALKKAFSSLTPGRQRAYLLHINAAKQTNTRTSRIEKCGHRILAGKGIADQ